MATPLGLYLNCASAGLYMANYQLVIPTVSRFLQHMGVDQSAAGLVIGCCDIASIPVTVGGHHAAILQYTTAIHTPYYPYEISLYYIYSEASCHALLPFQQNDMAI